MPLTSSTFHPFQNPSTTSSRPQIPSRSQSISGSSGPFSTATLRTTPTGQTPIPFQTGLLDRLRTPITRYHE